ncbi:general substrate transporter [Pestalotiopsis sp. NC0098]|nr:general substrate transporter [Pestalotiopsis sp. NC0098]
MDGEQKTAKLEDGGPVVGKLNFELEENAAQGTASESRMTISQALKYYRTAVMWSLIVSMATIMESYMLILVNSFYAYPQFLQRFGERLADGSYTISTTWQISLTMFNLVGMIAGVFLNGLLIDRFGYRLTMMCSHILLIGFVFIMFFAASVQVLLVGCLFLAVPCGVFAAATPGYAAEICPMVLRGYLTTFVNLGWVIGHLIAAGVLMAKLDDPSEWSWRLPLAIQWVWPPFLAVACWFAPESPWWLTRKGRTEEAMNVLDRIISAPEETVRKSDIVAMISHTIATERSVGVGSTYADCFRGTNRRRTEIAMISWGCQILPGFAIQNYITYFFTLAGLSPADSLKLALGNYSIAFVGTVLSWFVQRRFGRRDIYLTGLLVMVFPMALVGFLDLAPSSSSIRWAQAALLLVWFFCYGITIGPIPYAIAAEVGAVELRSKTISLGRNTYYLISILNTIVAPYMLNASAGNLRGKAAFPAAVFTLMLALWAFFRLPETKGLTPETLDRLFLAKVSARRFLAESKEYSNVME